MVGDRENDRSLTGVDAALSESLTDAVDGAIDLRDVAGARSLLRGALVEAFISLRRAALSGLDGEGRAEAMTARLAELEADVFLLKAAAAGATGAEAAHRDPLALAAALAADAACEGGCDLPASTVVSMPFDAAALCGGWGAPETDMDGVARRWTASGGRASVVLPSPWRGGCVVEAEARFSDGADAAAARSALLVESAAAVCALSVESAEADRLRLRVEVVPQTPRRGGFLFLEFSLASAAPCRALGVSRFTVRRMDPDPAMAR